MDDYIDLVIAKLDEDHIVLRAPWNTVRAGDTVYVRGDGNYEALEVIAERKTKVLMELPKVTAIMVRVQTNKSNIASNFNAASSMTGGSIWNASGITFNIFRDVEKHGAIKALSFPTNGKTIGAGTIIEILGVAK